MKLPPTKTQQYAQQHQFQQLLYFGRSKLLPMTVKTIKILFWVDPRSLYGRQVVTKTVTQLALQLAWIASVTNVINSFGVFPIFLAAFGDMIPLSMLFAVGLAVLQNYFTALLVRRGEFKRLARAGAVGLITLQVFLSSVSTPGGQLVGSPKALASDRAPVILTEARSQLEAAEQSFMKSALYLETKQNCEEGRKRMDAPPPASERDRVILETVGSWAERNRLGISATPESFCGKWETLQSETHEKYSQLDRQIEDAFSQGLTPLEVVRQVLPDQYEAEFTPQGTIADGNTAIAVAMTRSLRLLFQGRIGELGTSLLLFLLSTVTSAVLILALIAYARHPAVIMSFSPQAGLIKQKFFQ